MMGPDSLEPVRETEPGESVEAMPVETAMAEDLTRLSATDIAHRVRARELSPVAVVEANAE